MKILCIYHANCADGFGAAWAVRHAFGADNFEGVPATYGSPPPDVTGRQVVIVDFSYPYDVLVEMARVAESVIVLDHHKTAAADLARLPQFSTAAADDGSYNMHWRAALDALALALSMARRNDRDVGPDVAYSVGTGLPHQQQRVINWLAGKLLDGTGRVGQRNQSRVLHAASHAYELVIGTRRHITPPPGKEAHRDFELLVNIGAGWLWIAMEFAVERAERALCPA